MSLEFEDDHHDISFHEPRFDEQWSALSDEQRAWVKKHVDESDEFHTYYDASITADMELDAYRTLLKRGTDWIDMQMKADTQKTAEAVQKEETSQYNKLTDFQKSLLNAHLEAIENGIYGEGYAEKIWGDRYIPIREKREMILEEIPDLISELESNARFNGKERILPKPVVGKKNLEMQKMQQESERNNANEFDWFTR